MLFPQYCPACKLQCDYKTELGEIFEEVKNSAYKIIKVKGATYYAVALALVRIVAAILRDENSVLPVSTLIDDYYSINDVCLGIPSVVNRNGVERILKLDLPSAEQEQLRHSAQALKEVIAGIKW